MTKLSGIAEHRPLRHLVSRAATSAIAVSSLALISGNKKNMKVGRKNLPQYKYRKKQRLAIAE